MQFYQKRDFGSLISDTFTFFKENGKNYFKNYILINGLLLILLVVLVVIGYRELFSQLLGSNTQGQNYFFEAYFQENKWMLILVTMAVFIIFLAVSMISYTYPILYMKRLSETGNKNITTDEILSDLKNNLGRFFKLLIGLLFIVTPIAFVLIGFTYLLILILIGLFLLVLVLPTIMNVVNFLMYDYFHTKKSFFKSLSYALRAQFSYPNGREKAPFWKYWGSTIVIYLVIQTITSIFTVIPMVIMIATTFTIPQENGDLQQNPFNGSMGVFFLLIYAVSLLLSFLMMNILYVCAGFQYYDSRTDLHRNVDLSEIDTIGTHEH